MGIILLTSGAYGISLLFFKNKIFVPVVCNTIFSFLSALGSSLVLVL